MKSNIIGLLMIGLLIAGAIMMGGSYKLFINLPSMIIVLGITIGGLIHRFGLSGFSLLVSKNKTRLIYCRYGKFLSIISGLLGTAIALVQIFSNLDNFARAGDAFAVTFLALFYGFLLALVFHLFESDVASEDVD